MTEPITEAEAEEDTTLTPSSEVIALGLVALVATPVCLGLLIIFAVELWFDEPDV